MKVLLLVLALIATVFSSKVCLDSIQRACAYGNCMGGGPCNTGGGCLKMVRTIKAPCWPLAIDISDVYRKYEEEDVSKVIQIVSDNYHHSRIDLIRKFEREYSYTQQQILNEIIDVL